MLDLTLKITADATAAKAALRDVDQGIKQIDATAQKSSTNQATWWQKEEQSIEKVTGTVASHRAELSRTEQGYAKLQAATLGAEQVAAKLGSTSVTTSAALSGVSAETVGLTGGLEALVGVGGLSAGVMTALSGGAILAATALGALIGLVVDATAYYYEHAAATKASRDAQEDLTAAWHVFQMEVGGAVLGEDFSAVYLFHLLSAGAMEAGVRLSSYITLYKELLGLTTTQSALGLTNELGAIPDPSKVLGGKHPLGSLLPWGETGAGAMTVPTGSQAEAIFNHDEALRKQQLRESLAAAHKLALAHERAAAEIAAIIEHGTGIRLGLSGQIGTQFARPTDPSGFDPTGMLKYQLGIHGGSLPEVVSVKDMLAGVVKGPSFLQNPALYRALFAMGGQIGDPRTSQYLNLGMQLSGSKASGGLGLFQAGGAGMAIGGGMASMGLGLMTQAKGTWANIGAGAMTGAGIGTMIMPGIGTAIGAGVGALVGFAKKMLQETQGHKDLVAGNKEIADLKAALAAQYGSTAAAGTAGSIFGVDLSGAMNGQNLAGAKWLKDNIDLLAQKQATFNDALGGTLGKIKDLGGGIPQALVPYLDSLKEAKVLTQDNIDLIASMAADSAPNWQQMEEAANRLGISTDALGQSFQNAKAAANWQSVIDDLDLLIRGGADMNAMLGDEGLQGKFNALVQQSIQFGTTIPSNMKPWIQKLIDAGKLLGATGEKITDINELTFGDTMQTTLEKLNDTLKDLIDALAVKLPAAAREGAAGWHSALDGLELPGGGGSGGGKTPPGGDGTAPGIPDSMRAAARASSQVPVRIELQGRALWAGLIDVAHAQGLR